MIVWELFGLWALACFAWENLALCRLAAFAAFAVAVVYTTGSAVFGNWWPLILLLYAPIVYQCLFTLTFGEAIAECLGLVLLIGVSASTGETIWDVMRDLAQAVHGVSQ